jgi:hypothetical protein
MLMLSMPSPLLHYGWMRRDFSLIAFSSQKNGQKIVAGGPGMPVAQ